LKENLTKKFRSNKFYENGDDDEFIVGSAKPKGNFNRKIGGQLGATRTNKYTNYTTTESLTQTKRNKEINSTNLKMLGDFKPRYIPENNVPISNVISSSLHSSSVFKKKPDAHMTEKFIYLSEISDSNIKTLPSSSKYYSNTKPQTQNNVVIGGNSITSFSKTPAVRTLNINDLPSVQNPGSLKESKLLESNVSRKSHKSTTFKTIDISALSNLSKNEKKVLDKFKTLIKEKLIISKDGEVKKEDNQATIMLKEMNEKEVESKEESEQVEESEDASEIDLKKEIKNEIDAHVKHEEPEEEEDELDEEEEKELLNQVFDEYMMNYQTNQTHEETEIINEYKEHVLNNYLDDTMNRTDVSGSYLLEGSRFLESDKNQTLSQGLKKKLEEFPSFLKEAEEKGILDELKKKKQDEPKRETLAVNQSSGQNLSRSMHEDEYVSERYMLKINKSQTEVQEAPKDKLVEIKTEVIKTITNEKIPENGRNTTCTYVVNVPEETINLTETVEAVKNPNEGCTYVVNVPQETITLTETVEAVKNPNDSCTYVVQVPQERAPLEHTIGIENEEAERPVKGVVEMVPVHVENDDDDAEKLENINEIIQEADENGYFDRLREKAAQEKNVNTTETKQQIRLVNTENKNAVMSGIRNQLMIDAHIKTGIKEESGENINESDIKFSNAFDSEKEVLKLEPYLPPPEDLPTPMYSPKDRAVKSSTLKINLDSFDSRRYGNHQDYKLSQSRIKNSRGNWESLNASKVVVEQKNTPVEEKRTSIVHRRTSSRVRLGDHVQDTSTYQTAPATRTINAGRTITNTRNVTGTSITNIGSSQRVTSRNRIRGGSNNAEMLYERFESVKQMDPLRTSALGSMNKSKVKVSDWKPKTHRSENVSVKRVVTPTNAKISNTHVSRITSGQRQLNGSTQNKIGTLSSLIKTNIDMNHQTEKKVNTHKIMPLTNDLRERISKAHTPLSKPKKKKINLSHYRSNKMTASGTKRAAMSKQREGMKSSRVRTNVSGVSGTRTIESSTQGRHQGWLSSNQDLKNSVIVKEETKNVRRIKL
jgi:hypothetical protein